VTANHTNVANAIEASDAYDQQFDTLITAGQTVQDAYWGLAITDVIDALEISGPPSTPATAPTGSCRSRCHPSAPGTPTRASRTPGSVDAQTRWCDARSKAYVSRAVRRTMSRSS
jgi:hypothetical protein